MNFNHIIQTVSTVLHSKYSTPVCVSLFLIFQLHFKFTKPYLGVDVFEMFAAAQSILDGNWMSFNYANPNDISQIEPHPYHIVPVGMPILYAIVNMITDDYFLTNFLITCCAYGLFVYSVVKIKRHIFPEVSKVYLNWFFIFMSFSFTPFLNVMVPDMTCAAMFLFISYIFWKILHQPNVEFWNFLWLGLLSFLLCFFRFAYYPHAFLVPLALVICTFSFADKKHLRKLAFVTLLFTSLLILGQMIYQKFIAQEFVRDVEGHISGKYHVVNFGSLKYMVPFMIEGFLYLGNIRVLLSSLNVAELSQIKPLNALLNIPSILLFLGFIWKIWITLKQDLIRNKDRLMIVLLYIVNGAAAVAMLSYLSTLAAEDCEVFRVMYTRYFTILIVVVQLLTFFYVVPRLTKNYTYLVNFMLLLSMGINSLFYFHYTKTFSVVDGSAWLNEVSPDLNYSDYEQHVNFVRSKNGNVVYLSSPDSYYGPYFKHHTWLGGGAIVNHWNKEEQEVILNSTIPKEVFFYYKIGNKFPHNIWDKLKDKYVLDTSNDNVKIYIGTLN